MALLLDLRQLRRISIEERLTMIKQIWETILDEEDSFETPPELMEELKRRLADLDEHPEDSVPWEEVRAGLEARRKAIRSRSGGSRAERSRKRTTTSRSNKRA